MTSGAYVTFKRVFRLEKYLLVNSDARGRSYHISLRSGTNCLEIEKGRHLGISRELRFCKCCDSKAVEDEIHFLMHCPLYNQLREKCFKSILNISGGKWDLKSRPASESFVLLMQGTGDEHEKIIFRIFHCHLKRCFKLRNKEQQLSEQLFCLAVSFFFSLSSLLLFYRIYNIFWFSQVAPRGAMLFLK